MKKKGLSSQKLMWVGLRTNIFFCLALFHLLLLNSAWALSKHSTDSLHTLYEHEWRVAVSITMTRRKRASGQLFGSRECANIAIRYVTETNQHHHRYYLWYHCVAIQTCTSNTNGGISTVQGHRHDFQSGGFCDNCVRSTRKFFTLLCPEVINNPILYYSSIVQKFGGGGAEAHPPVYTLVASRLSSLKAWVWEICEVCTGQGAVDSETETCMCMESKPSSHLGHAN